MMKRFALIAFFAAVLLTVQARPAQACPLAFIPVVGQAICEVFIGDMTQTVVGDILRRFWSAFSASLQMKFRERMSIAEVRSEQARASQVESARSINRNMRSPTCTGVEQLQVANIAGGGSYGPRRGPPRFNYTRSPGGRRVMTDIEGDDGRPPEQMQRALQQEVMNEIAKIFTGTDEVSAANDSSLYNINNTRHRNSLYRNCDTERGPTVEGAPAPSTPCENGPMPDWDIDPNKAIFGNDTYADGSGDITEAMRITAGIDFCLNSISPEYAQRVRGANATANADAVMRAVQQRSADARIMMALDACIELVTKRKGVDIEVTDDNRAFEWVVEAVCAYRRALSNTRGTHSGDLLGSIEEGVETGPLGPVQTCELEGTVKMSDYEMMRTISTDLYATPRAIRNTTGNGEEGHLAQALVGMEAIESQLNWRILKMREKIQLLRATQLAVDIDRARGR
ncbi:MAG: hypothetical protein AB7G06_01920 [Bdellovibrionales bacterium]